MNKRYLVLSYYDDKKTLVLKSADSYELDLWIFNNFASSSKIKEHFKETIDLFISANNLANNKGDITILSYDEHTGVPTRHKIIYKKVINQTIKKINFSLFKKTFENLERKSEYELKECRRICKMYKSNLGYNTSMKKLIEDMFLSRLSKQKDIFDIIRTFYNQSKEVKTNQANFSNPNKGIRIDSYVIDDLDERRNAHNDIPIKANLDGQTTIPGYEFNPSEQSNSQKHCNLDELDYFCGSREPEDIGFQRCLSDRS